MNKLLEKAAEKLNEEDSKTVLANLSFEVKGQWVPYDSVPKVADVTGVRIGGVQPSGRTSVSPDPVVPLPVPRADVRTVKKEEEPVKKEEPVVSRTHI